MTKRLFTSESVTEGHPDKLCDCVSDAVLDAALAEDPNARVACETAAAAGLLLIMGEITSSARIDAVGIARRVISEIGYDSTESGFDANTVPVVTAFSRQSLDIALGVDAALEQKNGEHEAYFATGAGDQGMMFGFACDQTEEKMPLPIALAHRLTRRLTEARKNGALPFLRPDGKSQVTVEYIDGIPARVDTVVVSAQHAVTDLAALRKAVAETVVLPVLPASLIDAETRILINPTGRFVTGGPAGDAGLTGRKIIVDTYGGYARHGGGCFSGKDPTKVDRSAAYMARYAAKNVVAAGLARECEIQLAYAIGVARPVSLRVDTFSTGVVEEEEIERAVRRVFDFRPAAIIEQLDLRRPIYRPTAAYGHFGRTELDLPWERTDRVQALTDAVR